jgi:hypothetical protein
MDIADEVKAIFDEKNGIIKQLREVIDSLLAANKDLQAWYDSSREDAARLREALVFYASFADALPHENIAPLMIDRGNKARAALKEGE